MPIFFFLGKNSIIADEVITRDTKGISYSKDIFLPPILPIDEIPEKMN